MALRPLPFAVLATSGLFISGHLISGLLISGLAANTARAEEFAVLKNPTAYIPPQCYTKTELTEEAFTPAERGGALLNGQAANPCQSCHVRSRAPHYINDQDLQLDYAFPEPARKNPWTNLFKDRRAAIAATDPAEIDAYAMQDNYRDPEGITLARALQSLPPAWDADGDRVWSGYIPDIWFNFDEEGFDLGLDGAPTGWRAFAYQPVSGGFLPTNGAADDVMIRLPTAYREDAQGRPDRAIYKLNLAVVEALIKRQDIAIEPTDEAALGVDLDRDGALTTATTLRFAFNPRAGETMRYLGRAGDLPREEAPLAAGLYPLGTEFLHSLRYLAPDPDAFAPRMKELRYMRKTRWLSYFDRQDAGLAEAKERSDFPDRIASFFGDAEHGISNGTGWRLQGFIEDAAGDLRPQSYEETVFCMGCHGGIGANDDDTLAFARKRGGDAPAGGWYHWSARGLKGLPDLIRADGTGDLAHYIASVGAADDLRANTQALEAALKHPDLSQDISPVALPGADPAGRERARALNAAYREVVREQSFTLGRDAVLAPLTERVWRALPEGAQTGVKQIEEPWYPR